MARQYDHSFFFNVTPCIMCLLWKPLHWEETHHQLSSFCPFLVHFLWLFSASLFTMADQIMIYRVLFQRLREPKMSQNKQVAPILSARWKRSVLSKVWAGESEAGLGRILVEGARTFFLPTSFENLLQFRSRNGLTILIIRRLLHPQKFTSYHLSDFSDKWRVQAFSSWPGHPATTLSLGYISWLNFHQNLLFLFISLYRQEVSNNIFGTPTGFLSPISKTKFSFQFQLWTSSFEG